MKPEELRIGNWVKSNVSGNEFRFTSYHFNDFLLSNHPKPRLEPIPLTEKWLLKFGFYGWAGYFSKSNFLFDKQTNTLSWHGIMLHDSIWNEVHKLQNLYFSLTGQELTIK